MVRNFVKIPLLCELFINGAFVIYFSLEKFNGLPQILNTVYLKNLIHQATWFAPMLIFLTIISHMKQSMDIEDFFRKYIFSIIIFIPMLMTYGDIEFCYWLTVVHLFSSVLTLNDEKNDSVSSKSTLRIGWDILHMYHFKPAQIVVLSFGIIILIGALLLVLPISAVADKKIAFIDALFMSTSATCVTGLATKSLPDDFSLFGQIVLLALIQIGGLGIMTLSSSLSLFMGKSLGVKEQVLMQDVLESTSSEDLLKLIQNIIRFTISIETIGALILAVGFYQEDYEIGQALYMGFYHSISAFCNAGLALFNNNLEDFFNRPLINVTIAFLIIAGGLGFSVIQEIASGIKTRKKFVNYTLHSKIVIVMNLMLLSVGFCYIFFGEFLHSMEAMSLSEKIQVSFFQSVTTRTAGFNSINLNQFHPHTIYLMILLMFVGASPGSTGGGIKTTTFAILLQSIRSTLQNKNKVEFFEKSIPPETVVKSIAIFILSLMLVSLVVLLMMRFEPNHTFFNLLFEVVSAFGTVGLSLGITPLLTVMGKTIIIILMFIGRVGPLTLILAVGENKNKAELRYPEGRVLIG